ncbi:MAG: hypothetical protein MJZ85_11445, partial [Bacteroidales bacterium]|nr:hypothetical protein [Bacteroidales bacterium]
TPDFSVFLLFLKFLSCTKGKNIQFDLFKTKTYKTRKTFLYSLLNLATARFKSAFRLFSTNIFRSGSKSILLPFLLVSVKSLADSQTVIFLSLSASI